MTGSRLGHFEIQAKIGEGGMGAVYRAKDLNLGRTVALKVLPPAMTSIPERKARFIQEAKAASSLQHPNIVTVHEIGVENGVDFIAMELVEGKTLAKLIPRGGMSADEALPIARQMADGLSKAHDAKIVHRDLKPSNVMVSTDGLVKILDFGLAKLLPTASISQDDGATATNLQTEPGAILGTFAYMSPEQAAGRALDARSDIFSFGSVLYEMLVGRPAFHRDTYTGTMAAVMRDPVDMNGVPVNLAGVVSRCLQKDLDRRFQTMADVRAALLDAGDAAQKAAGGSRWWVVPVAAVLVALAGVWWWRMQDRLPPMRVVPFTSDAGFESSPTFSPDGTQVAYVSDGGKQQDSHIYVKMVSSPTTLQLTTNPGGVASPSWSPDGKLIAYHAVRNDKLGLYVISPLGGPERRVGDSPGFGQLSWTPDGKYLVGARTDNETDSGRGARSILLVPLDGSDPKILIAPDKRTVYKVPDVHPAGRFLSYAACTGGGSDPLCEARVIGLTSEWSATGTVKTVLSARRFIQLRWTSDGESLLYAGGTGTRYLWRVGVDGGAPLRLELAGASAVSPTVARRGNRAAFVRLFTNDDIWRMDEGGSTRPLLTSSLRDMSARFSPDGTRIAFASQRGGDSTEIWVASADGAAQRPLTNGPGIFQGSPAWSPDGKQIVFDSQDEVTAIYQIWRIESSGGTARQLTKLPKGAAAPFWSRDGRYIYFTASSGRQFDIHRIPAEGGTIEQVTMTGGYAPQESPDGKTLYYTKTGDISDLYAMPVGGGAEKKVIDSVWFRGFQVFADGVYYHGFDGKEQIRFHDFASGKERVIGVLDGHGGFYLSVSPDRKAILFTHLPQPGSDLMLIENFR